MLESCEQIMSDLKFISMINKNDVVNVRRRCLQPKSWWTSFDRTFVHYDNRENCLAFLSATVHNAFLYVENCMLRSIESDITHNVLVHLLHNIIHCVPGLLNLQYSYKTDQNFYSQLDTLIMGVKGRLDGVRKSNPDIYYSASNVISDKMALTNYNPAPIPTPTPNPTPGLSSSNLSNSPSPRHDETSPSDYHSSILDHAASRLVDKPASTTDYSNSSRRGFFSP